MLLFCIICDVLGFYGLYSNTSKKKKTPPVYLEAQTEQKYAMWYIMFIILTKSKM